MLKAAEAFCALACCGGSPLELIVTVDIGEHVVDDELGNAPITQHPFHDEESFSMPDQVFRHNLFGQTVIAEVSELTKPFHNRVDVRRVK